MKTFAGKKGIVTGWGALEEGGSISPILQEVVVPILTNAECRATKYPSRKITDNMMCAGFKEGGKDSCQVSKSRINLKLRNREGNVRTPDIFKLFILNN